MGLTMKKFNIMGGLLNNPIFRGGVSNNQYIGGNCLKRELGQFPDLRGGGLGKKKGVVFMDLH